MFPPLFPVLTPPFSRCWPPPQLRSVIPSSRWPRATLRTRPWTPPRGRPRPCPAGGNAPKNPIPTSSFSCEPPQDPPRTLDQPRELQLRLGGAAGTSPPSNWGCFGSLLPLLPLPQLWGPLTLQGLPKFPGIPPEFTVRGCSGWGGLFIAPLRTPPATPPPNKENLNRAQCPCGFPGGSGAFPGRSRCFPGGFWHFSRTGVF